MIKFNTLKEVVQFRITESEDNYWIEDYWKVAIEMFTKDVATTIMFLQNDCDDEELYVLSEIFEEIVEKTQSKEIISTLRSRLSVFFHIFYSRFLTHTWHSECLKKEIPSELLYLSYFKSRFTKNLSLYWFFFTNYSSSESSHFSMAFFAVVSPKIIARIPSAYFSNIATDIKNKQKYQTHVFSPTKAQIFLKILRFQKQYANMRFFSLLSNKKLYHSTFWKE